MPIDPGSGVFARIWQFVDQFEIGDDITREALDVALDDFVEAINEALLVVATAAASAAAAAASAAAAETAGATAGETAGADAAEAAAAVHVAAMVAAVQAVEDYLEDIEGYVDQITPSNFLALGQTTAFTGDCDAIAETKLHRIGTGATNGPSGFASGDWLLSLRVDANSAIQIVFSHATNLPISMRRRAAGVWGSWDGVVTQAATQTIAGPKTFSGAATFSAAASFTDDIALEGATSASVDDGTKSSGTYTPTPVGGNFRHATNDGAFTLAAPTASGTYSMVIDITNGASAGAITFSGLLRTPTGDPLTTINGHKFRLYITKGSAGVTCNVEALQ